MITLDVLVPGESGKILAVGGEGALRHRLLDMGLTPKTIVKVEKNSTDGRSDGTVSARVSADASQRRCA